jgi:hypothetical protein
MKGDTMEHITMTVAMTDSMLGIPTLLKGLWIGEDQVPTQGRTLKQCLDDMQHGGWVLTSASAYLDQKGIVCKYKYARSSSPMASLSSKSLQ